MIRILFSITDFFAWIFFGLTLVACVTAPFGHPAYLKMAGEAVTFMRVAFEMVGLGLVSVGFFLLAKRKIVGFLFIIIASILLSLVRENISEIYALIAILVFFGIPWGLGFYVHPIKNNDSHNKSLQQNDSVE
jgi:hypothetical protein